MAAPNGVQGGPGSIPASRPISLPLTSSVASISQAKPVKPRRREVERAVAIQENPSRILGVHRDPGCGVAIFSPPLRRDFLQAAVESAVAISSPLSRCGSRCREVGSVVAIFFHASQCRPICRESGLSVAIFLPASRLSPIRRDSPGAVTKRIYGIAIPNPCRDVRIGVAMSFPASQSPDRCRNLPGDRDGWAPAERQNSAPCLLNRDGIATVCGLSSEVVGARL